LVIPQYVQWTIGGQSFYNPNTINIPITGTAITTTLTRGQITSSTFTASGSAYQLYVLGSPGAWNISDVSPWAIDSLGNVWTAVRDGLWKQGGSNVFFESTLPDGTVECKFGDGTYGNLPPAGTMTFYYTLLATAIATAVGLAVGSIGSPNSYTVTATTTDIASPNQDPPSPDFYKAVGPGGPANLGRAVTRDDHRAIALEYDGVIDALFRGQAELNPADLRYMNIIAVTLITTSPWTQADWIAFKLYFEGSVGIATTTFIRSDPTVVSVTLNIDIAIFSTSSIDTVTTLALQVLTSYFTPSNTSLGRTLEPSDLILAIMESATYLQAPGESGELIDYVRVKLPSAPVVASPTQYLTINGTPYLNVFYTSRGISPSLTGAIVGL
jgi:hypothetical protein